MKSILQLFLDKKNRFIVISNFIVLFSVFLFDYTVYSIFILFWAETIVFGVFAFLKQVFSKTDITPGAPSSQDNADNSIFYRLITATIWLAIYGFFMHVLGKFISDLFGPGWYGDIMGGYDLSVDLFLSVIQSDLKWGWIALLIPHLYDFINNFLIKKGREKIPFMFLTMGPWFRVAVLQIAIIISGGIIIIFNEGIPALIILIILKSIYDMAAQKISDKVSGLNE